MSESSAIPFPKVRDLLAAKTGTLFFVKWLICVALGVIFRGTFLVLYLASGLPRLVPAVNFLWWGIIVLLQVWCIFGFRWRTWVWIAADWTILWWITYAWRGGTLLAAPLGIVIKTLLLLGVRRNLGVVLLALTASHFLESAAIWRPLFIAFGKWLDQFQAGWVPRLWLNFQVQQALKSYRH